MRNKSLSVVTFLFPLIAMAQSPYEPSEQDREENIGCLSSRCIANMELDNRNLPLIRVAPSFSTRLKFPREVVKCEDETDTIRITDADSPDDDDKSAKHVRKPFWQARVKVVIDPGKVQGSIFNLPEVNVLCDFTNGDTVTFYAKVSPDPHHIVRFVDKGVEQSGLAWLFEQQGKGGVIPIELSPKRGSAPVDVVRFDNGTGRTDKKSEKEVLERLFAEGARRKK
jgi:hypothetical protein